MVTPHPEDILLDTFRRQYLQLLTPTEIDLSLIPPQLLLTESFQNRLYTDLFNPQSHQWPPPPRYTARVVKRFITAIEEAAFAEGYGCPEIDDSLIDFYATLISTTPASSSTPPDSRSHVTYTITPPSHPTREQVALVESRSIISGSGHTGARTWEAAMALGELLMSTHYETKHPLIHPNSIFSTVIKDKSVLELGAGTGFLGILAAKMGAKKVLATDGDWRVCDALRGNVEENGVEEVVEVGRLLWGTEVVEKSEDGEGEGDVREKGEEEKGYIIPDVVLAADVTYDSTVVPELVSELKYILSKKNPHAQVLLAATVRNTDTFETFLRELEGHSLAWASELWTPHDPRILYYPTTTPIRILKITCPLAALAAT